MKKKFCLTLVIGLIGVSFAACSSLTGSSADMENAVVVVGKSAPVPEGVVRYCWEEPMVKNEENGPGLDAQGHWYNPRYTAVREVRQGKWKPCTPEVSETTQEVQ